MGLRPSVRNNDGGGSNQNAKRDNESINEDTISGNNKNNINDQPFQSSDRSPTHLPYQPPTQPPKREAWTARGKLLLNFHDVIARAINSPEMIQKCSQIASEMSSSNSEHSNETKEVKKSNSLLASDYSAEAALIVQNKSRRDAEVRNKSVAFGIATFLSLRGIPMLRRSISSWTARTGGYKLDKLPNYYTNRDQIKNASIMPHNNITIKRMENNHHGNVKEPSNFRKSLRFVFDAAVSTSVTLLSGTFLFMPRPSAYVEDMATLPLVEGKSVYAEMVCPPLLKEYKRVLELYGGRWPVKGMQAEDSKNDKANAGVTQEDMSLNVIRKFVENCSKRSKYERALLEERSALMKVSNSKKETNKLGTVAVPSPGVPKDMGIKIDQDILVLAVATDVEEEEETKY